jgi:ribonucleoside-diphosphate reductase beta chain
VSQLDNSFNVNDRRLILGPRNNLMAISPLKHAWARDLWKVLLANTWFPQEVDMSRDIKQYRAPDALTEADKRMYRMALAFVSNLDGIQFNNLTFNIGHHITSPEVSMLISRQAFEEGLHVDAYSTMIEAVTDDPMSIYTLFAHDDILGAKNEHILKQSALLGDEFNAKNFTMALVANMMLEGVYFFSGFLTFYILARQGKMLGSADQVRFIQRDEETHLEIFARCYETQKVECPEVFTPQFYREVDELMNASAELEIAWGTHIIGDGVLGTTPELHRAYIQSLVDKRRARIGLPPLYGVKNPYSWVEQFSQVKGTETNFFEGRVASYQVGGQLDW